MSKKQYKCLGCGGDNDKKFHFYFCSKNCRLNYYYNKFGGYNCKNCGNYFIKVSESNNYCSYECCNTYRKNNIVWNNTLSNRFKIFIRDKFRCGYCGRNVFEHDIILQIDHIHPKSRGGIDCESNYITSCSDCNIGKCDIILDCETIKRINLGGFKIEKKKKKTNI